MNTSDATIMEYHKGEFCPYKKIPCVEGYCSNCFIYSEVKKLRKTKKHIVDTEGTKNNAN